MSVIDKDGYRANVAMIIINGENQVFWGRRVHQNSWQFPQGGVNKNESAVQAMYRELQEEVGLKPQDVELLASTSEWFEYALPTHLIRQVEPLCIGQKQKWFLLRLVGEESCINLNAADIPEFNDWKWVDYWEPAKQVIDFKRPVYERALHYFEPTLTKAAD